MRRPAFFMVGGAVRWLGGGRSPSDLHADRHLALVLIVGHALVGVGGLLEVEALVEHRLDAAVDDELVGPVGLERVGEVRADDLLLPHPQVADVELELVAGGGAADDDLAELLGHQDRGREGLGPDVLEHDVGIVATGELADLLAEPARLLRPLAEVELAAVDDELGAQAPAQLGLVVARDHGDRRRAGQLAQLDGEHAQAPGGAPDQHVVARLHVGAPEQHPVGGEEGEAVAGRLLPGQVLGLGQELLRLDQAELGEGAPVGLVAPDLLVLAGQRVLAVARRALAARLVAVQDHLVADLPALHRATDLPDDSGRVRAGDVEVLLRVHLHGRYRLAARGPDAVEVDAGGHHHHQDVERPDLGHRDLLDAHRVARLALAIGADDDGAHQLRQLAERRRGGEIEQAGGHGELLFAWVRSTSSTRVPPSARG